MSELLDSARSWAAEDPDPHTRDSLLALTSAADEGDAAALRELEDAFADRLQFGTAGLRGTLGPGPNRMNRVVVMQSAAGLAAYLVEHGGGAVVIGYDARTNSDVFAHDIAAVLTGAGLGAMVLPHPLPTPVLAFAIRHLGCAAGVMVTASHNPPQDNGMKVYLGDGMQIVSPADREIAAHIDKVAQRPLAEIPLGEDWSTLSNTLLDDYIARASTLVELVGPPHVRIAYTPMHGVGGEVFCRVLERAGFPEPVVVEAQYRPDPTFPTVAFPNPEEPGAMDLAIATAAEANADLLIAHDPDADRCAVGIPVGGRWRMLSGDEVGWLLGWWIAAGERRVARRGAMAQSIVSGTMLRGIAEQAGLGYEQTLTGFKWISRVQDLVFGYEEALGYCVDPNGVRDKDGITAALLIVELAGHLTAQGTGIQGILDDLARAHGVHLTSQVSLRVQNLEQITGLMASLRAAPPTEIGGIRVLGVDDLASPLDGLPPTDGLRFELDSSARVIIRPSGTEPKVKIYLQAVQPVDGDSLEQARAQAEETMAALRQGVAKWLDQ